MSKDPWHYPREALAAQLLGLFATGLSSALVFFAPRRMGKTQFLRKDVLPLAEKNGWKVLYFSFLDCDGAATPLFSQALVRFADEAGVLRKTRGLLRKVTKITGEAAGIKAGVEWQQAHDPNQRMKETFMEIAKQKKILLLLDEVQALALHNSNANFVAALRTALDTHKDSIKVIFTGSSQEGLRRMFSQAKAPFFHFGQNLPFPELDRGFTDHLAHMFAVVTQRDIDKELLWRAFIDLQKIPQLARALVERLALNPTVSLDEVKAQLLADIFDDREFVALWQKSSPLERLLLHTIANGGSELFSTNTRAHFAKMLGMSKLTVPSVQSALRVLMRQNLVGLSPERGNYFIDDLNFKNWLGGVTSPLCTDFIGVS